MIEGEVGIGRDHPIYSGGADPHSVEGGLPPMPMDNPVGVNYTPPRLPSTPIPAVDTTKPKAPAVDSTAKEEPEPIDINFMPRHGRPAQSDDSDDTTSTPAPATPTPVQPDNSNRILGGIGNADHDREVRARQDSARRAKMPVLKRKGGIQ